MAQAQSGILEDALSEAGEGIRHHSFSAINTYASSPPPRDAIAPFEEAVTRYERERNRPARGLAASILGYKSVPAYDASGSA